jgi:resuscitation-promoting factor RpfB
MLTIVLLAMSIDTRKTVFLNLNGEIFPIETTAITLLQLLQEEDIALRDGDQISPDISTWLSDGDTVSIQQAIQIFIQVDGYGKTLLTTQRKPIKLLEESEVLLQPHDLILANGLPIAVESPLPMAETYSLQVRRARQISLEIGSETNFFYSTAATLGQALWEQGISLYNGDELVPPPETPLVGDIQANLILSQKLLIHFNEGELEVRSNASSIGEILAETGIPLQGLNYSSPPPEAPLPSNGQVRLVRVEEIISLETEPIPFTVEYQPLADLEIDNQKIVQLGQYGLSAHRVRIRLEDGEQVSHHIEAEFISKLPQPRVIGYGTNIIPRTIDTASGSLQYWRALQMYAVSYNPTSAGGNITASGLPLRKGLVAVDPRIIPLGTQMYVPGYGNALAADTGGGVRGRIIDLGYSDDDYEHWSSWVTVYFLWPPPENIVWIIP